ncbi:hypothetical protein BH09ACT4_BH09ACT4_11670 [soil metagenome]
MLRHRIARAVAGALVGALVVVGLTALPAAGAGTRVVAGTIYLGSTARAAVSDEVAITLYGPSDSWYVIATTTSGADGSYRFDGLIATTYRIKYTYSGTGDFATEFWWPNTPLATSSDLVNVQLASKLDADIVIPLPGPLAGLVTLGDTDHPAGAGDVDVYYRSFDTGLSDWSPEVLGATTTADGTWQIPALPAALYKVRLDYVGSEHFQDYEFPNLTFAGGAGRLNYGRTLRPSATISGKVYLGGTGLVVPDGTTTVQVSNPYLGHFAAPVVAGAFRFGDLRTGIWTVTATYTGDDSYQSNATTASVDTAEKVADIQLTRLHNISGTVYLDKKGGVTAPAGLVRIDMLNYLGNVIGTPSTTTYTTAGGHYEFRHLDPSAYNAKFTYLGAEDYPAWYLTDLAGIGSDWQPFGSIFQIAPDIVGANVVVGAGAAIEGVLTDSGKHPLAGQPIALYVVGPDLLVPKMLEETTTNAQGRYRFRSLSVGTTYRVWYGGSAFADDRWGWHTTTPYGAGITLAKDQVRTGVNATLFAAATISGKVSAAGYLTQHLDLSDDATTELFRYDTKTKKWGATQFGAVADDGTYAFGHLPPGTYRVRIHFDGWEATGSKTSPSLKVAAGKVVTWNGTVQSKQLGLLRDFTGDDDPEIFWRDAAGTLQMGIVSAGIYNGSVPISSGWDDLDVFPVGDFDSDGLPDLMARDADGALQLFPGTGAGTLGAPVAVVGNLKGFTKIFSPGDFNGDGWSDVLAQGSSGALYLFRGDGHGNLVGRTRVGSATMWKSRYQIFSAGDFNGDGKSDILAQASNGTVYLYKGDGSGGISGTIKATTGTKLGSRLFSVGRVDSGACPDFFEQRTDGSMWVFLGTCKGTAVYRWPWSSGWSGATIS